MKFNINPNHPYCFVHTVRPSKQKSANGLQYQNLRLFIDIYSDDVAERKKHLQAIDRVVYQTHESYPVPVMVQQNWRDCFRLDLKNWGVFWVQATLIFKDESKPPIQLIRLLSLGDAEPIPSE